MPRKLLIPLILTSLVACEQLADLARFQKDVSAEFEATANVEFTSSSSGKTLSINFESADMAALDDSAQSSLARQAALFARDHYRGWAEVSRVSVSFVNKRSVGPVSVSRSSRAYTFQPETLGGGGAPEPATPRDSV
jgi:hypothetical protein